MSAGQFSTAATTVKVKQSKRQLANWPLLKHLETTLWTNKLNYHPKHPSSSSSSVLYLLPLTAQHNTIRRLSIQQRTDQ